MLRDTLTCAICDRKHRYSASQALLQGRKADAGSVARASAAEVETFVTSALRTNCAITPNVSDRDLIEGHLGRAEVRANEIAITTSQADASEAASLITILFAPNSPPQNGVRHVPAAKGKLKNADRIALMTTIARSRTWIEVLLLDPSADFGTIAQREKLAERHVRFLAPLAYLSPRVVEAIAEGRAPADLAVRRLARKPSLDWAEQAVALDG